MTGNEPEAPRGRGRPRDGEKDLAITDATWRILAEKGYEALTFEAVAEMAGCSRSTLYRRFASKGELVEAMLAQTSRRVEPRVDLGSPPRDILVAHATALCEYMAGPRGTAMLAMSISAAHNPELAGALERHSAGERPFYLREYARLCPGPASSDVLDFALDSLIGSVIFHIAVLHTTLSPQRISALVDASIALLDAMTD